MYPSEDIVLSDNLSLTFELMGSGWARLKISAGSREFEIDDFGNLENSFHDFALAAISAASCGGQGIFQFSLDGEPTVWRWTVNSSYRQNLGYYTHIRVDCFPDGDDFVTFNEGRFVRRIPDLEPEIVFDAYCSSDCFAVAVRKSFETFEEAGPEQFEEQWGLYPYPTRTLAALDAALATPRRWANPQPGAASGHALDSKSNQ
jgi:hypothetical protein